MEFPEETNEDNDDESSSSYQSAKDNLNSKSEVPITSDQGSNPGTNKQTELDVVDSGCTPITPTTPETNKSPSLKLANKNSNDVFVVPTHDPTKLKDAYKSNKTVSTPY